ncbi:MAG: efflux RND transporter periplasmic adaptor subunit [Chromatiales bacterium]
MNDLSKLRIDREDKVSVKRRGRWRKRMIALVLLLIAGAVVGRAYVTGQLKALEPKLKVEVGTVSTAYPSQALTLFNATGYVVPQTKADIASKATGRLEALEVEEGSRVSKGQIIARLENQDVTAAMERAKANVDAARSAVTEARARLGEAQARVAEARAELRDADRALQRAKAMVDKNYVTPEVYDAAVARQDKAAASLTSAEATVAAAAASIAAAQARVSAAEAAHQEAKVQVEYTLIRAPFDGVILSKQADIGDVVAPFSSTAQSKGAVVSMADLDTVQVETDVSESNLIKLAVGQACEIQLDALPDVRLRGEVHMIVPTVDRAKATVLAKVRFVDRDERVLPDMSARVAFLSRPIPPEANTPRIVVQPHAVVTRDGQSVVFRVADDRATQVSVTNSGRLGDLVVIEGDLKAGEKIVLDPPEKLEDGLRVVIANP